MIKPFSKPDSSVKEELQTSWVPSVQLFSDTDVSTI